MKKFADPITTGIHYTARIEHALDADCYPLSVEAGEGVEIELRGAPPDVEFDLELHDAQGNCLARSRALPDRVQIITYESDAADTVCVTVVSRLGIGPYTLHVDRYRTLSGIVAESSTLKAADGPYLLGGNGLTVLPGAALTVEAGTIFNLRSGGLLHVQKGAALHLNGSANARIVLLGARAVNGDALCQEIVLESELAICTRQYVAIQFDEHAMQELEFEPHTDIPPSQRPEIIKNWYLQASPYRFTVIDGLETTGKWYHPFSAHTIDLYFGLDVEQFTQWEVNSGRLSDERFCTGEVNYWEYVNSGFFADMLEAGRRSDAGLPSEDYRVQRLIDYRNAGKRWREEHGCLKLSQLYKLLDEEETYELTRHLDDMTVLFWISHNTSVVYWDKLARDEGWLEREDHFEHMFIDGVIMRLHFTADLPLRLIAFGNQFPPIGLMGVLMHTGPFSYPLEYPIPVPEDTIVDFHFRSTVEMIQTYFRFLLYHGTSPVFIWFLPTPADDQLGEALKQKGLTFDSSPEEWKREFLDPAWKTLHMIQEHYLHHDSALEMSDQEVRLQLNLA